MLTREIIQSIVECRLPESEIKAHLEAVPTDSVDPATLGDFIDAVRSTMSDDAGLLADVVGATDCSGTGGSGIPHFNVSTTIAFILAAGGQKVAKCGNRSAGGRSGSFDLLECLGIPLLLPAKAVLEILEATGVAFLFVPQYYPGLARLAAIRKAIGKRTIFNIIGPLVNPVRPFYRVMGVSCAAAQETVANYLVNDKVTRRSMLVRSDSGLDELEPDVNCKVFDVMQGYINKCEVKIPSLSKNGKEQHALLQFTPEENAKLFFEIINGKGPQWLTEFVCLNAAAGFLATGCSNLEASMELATELLVSGQVAEKVEQCRRAYARLSSR
ncbi:MAG TPA: anthranilate phosphoribosyltransferase [Planktothrix sp.]|jgi:anthranilate phosphoribosyltransferase